MVRPPLLSLSYHFLKLGFLLFAGPTRCVIPCMGLRNGALQSDNMPRERLFQRIEAVENFLQHSKGTAVHMDKGTIARQYMTCCAGIYLGLLFYCRMDFPTTMNLMLWHLVLHRFTSTAVSVPRQAHSRESSASQALISLLISLAAV